MSESKQRSKNKEMILGAATRCVYCASTDPCEVEHMPPRGLFKDKDRPSGWEFASCRDCNQDTRGADAVAQLFSMIEILGDTDWKLTEIPKVKRAIEKYAPGVIEELNRSKDEPFLIRKNNLLRPTVRMSLDGPIIKKYLDIFSLKLAIASFTELCGRNIKFPNFILTEWNLNSISQKHIDIITSIMPVYSELKQGRKKSGEQFSFRFNTDEKKISATFFSLHNSLYITCFATDDPDYMSALSRSYSEGIDHHPTRKITSFGLKELFNLPLAQHPPIPYTRPV